MIQKSIVSLFLMAFSAFQKPLVERFTQQWNAVTRSQGAVQEAQALNQLVADAARQGLIWEIEVQERATAQTIPVSELNSRLGSATRVLLTLKLVTLFGKKSVGQFQWEPIAAENVFILMRE